MIPVQTPSDALLNQIHAPQEMRDWFAAQKQLYEAAAQEALNEQKRLELKQREIDELKRKNDIEEQRTAELLRQGTKLDMVYALLNGLIDAHTEQHHNPMANMLSVMRQQLGYLIQAHQYLMAEYVKRPGVSQDALDLLSALGEQLRSFYTPQPMPSGKVAVFNLGDTSNSSQVNAPGANINKMNIGDR